MKNLKKDWIMRDSRLDCSDKNSIDEALEEEKKGRLLSKEEVFDFCKHIYRG